MIFRNVLIVVFFISTIVFAQPADSTTNKTVTVSSSQTTTVSSKRVTSSLKKSKKVTLPKTTWSKLKDMFQ